MPEHRLHCFARSDDACQVAPELAGADWRPVWVDFFRGAHRAPEFVAPNSMAEAPVLEQDGQVMSASGVILDYLTDTLTLDRHLDGRAWIAGDGISMADLSCCGYISYPEHDDFDRSRVPNVTAWRGRIAAPPGWRRRTT